MGYMNWESEARIEDMVGKVFTSVRNEGSELVFQNATESFVFFHQQDCCENVSIEEVERVAIGDSKRSRTAFSPLRT